MTRFRLIALIVAGLTGGMAIASVMTPSPASPAHVIAFMTPAPGPSEGLGQAGGGAGQRELVMTEAQVNQQITQQLQENKTALPLRDAQVRLRRDGRVDLRGITQVAGRDAAIQAIVKVDARHGTLNLEIESAQAGNVPVPAIVAQEIAERAIIAAGLSGLKGNALPDGIEAVTVEEGRLVITTR